MTKLNGNDKLIIYPYELNNSDTLLKIKNFISDVNINDMRIGYTWVNKDNKIINNDDLNDAVLIPDNILSIVNIFNDSNIFNIRYQFFIHSNMIILQFLIARKKNNTLLQSYLSKKSTIDKCFIINFPNTSTFDIYYSLMNEHVKMKNHLDEDASNIVFLCMLNNHTYQGYATDIESINRRDSSIIAIECKEEGNGTKYMLKDNTIFEKWYVRLGLDEYNNNKGISLEKLNCVQEEFDKGNRIFFLSEERTLKIVSTLSNVIVDEELFSNIYDERVNSISGVHCNDNTSINVYDNISICDITTFGNKTDDEILELSSQEEPLGLCIPSRVMYNYPE